MTLLLTVGEEDAMREDELPSLREEPALCVGVRVGPLVVVEDALAPPLCVALPLGVSLHSCTKLLDAMAETLRVSAALEVATLEADVMGGALCEDGCVASLETDGSAVDDGVELLPTLDERGDDTLLEGMLLKEAEMLP